MMKNIKRIICCALIGAICLSFAACSAKADEGKTTDPSTTTTTAQTQENTAENTTESTTEQTTPEESTSTTKKKQEKPSKDKSDKTQSITVNKALDILQSFYGKTYEVNATVNEDGYQYFAVFDKKGNKYASVKVNLDTADAVETVIENGATNSYNLLS